MFCGRDPQGMTEDAGAVPIVRADGQTLSVDGHAQAIGWDGAPATLIALRRSREAELKARLHAAEQEASMRNGAASDVQTMLDRATDGAVTLDSAGRILSLNHPAERLFGYDQDEIAGESVLMLLRRRAIPRRPRGSRASAVTANRGPPAPAPSRRTRSQRSPVGVGHDAGANRPERGPALLRAPARSQLRPRSSSGASPRRATPPRQRAPPRPTFSLRSATKSARPCTPSSVSRK